MTRLVALVPWILAACAPSPEAQVDGALPPPPVLDVTDLLPGQPLTLTVHGAVPGASVAFAASTQGPGSGPCPPQLRGSCLGVAAPAVLLGARFADASGVATLTVTAPASLPGGASPAFQAAQAPQHGAPSELSNVVQRTVPLADVPFTTDDIVDTATVPWDVTTASTSVVHTGSLAGDAGLLVTDVVALTGTVTYPGSTTPITGALVEDTGLGRYRVTLPLSAVSFRSTNPRSLSVHVDLEATDGAHHLATFAWTIGVLPDRIGLMWNGTTGYLVTSPLVVPRPGQAARFGTTTYATQLELRPGVWRLASAAGPVDLGGVALLDFTVGVHTGAGLADAAYDTFTELTTLPFLWAGLGDGAGTWEGGEIAVSTGVDYDSDGDIDVDDLIYLLTDVI